jgi:hypothetical protein
MYISISADTKLSYSFSVSDGTITVNSGTPVSTGSSFTLSSGTYYIGFLFSSSAQPGTGTIAFHYEIG